MVLYTSSAFCGTKSYPLSALVAQKVDNYKLLYPSLTFKLLNKFLNNLHLILIFISSHSLVIVIIYAPTPDKFEKVLHITSTYKINW